MTADVVIRLDVPGRRAHQNDRGVDGLELFGEVAALARKLFDATNVEPGTLENRLAFQLVDLWADGILIGHRLGAELRVVLRPAAFGRLGKSSHKRSCPFRSRTDPSAVRQPFGRGMATQPRFSVIRTTASSRRYVVIAL